MDPESEAAHTSELMQRLRHSTLYMQVPIHPRYDQQSVEVEFTGKVVHNNTVLKARRVTGKERDETRAYFVHKKDKSSRVYRERLRTLDDTSYAAENRISCGRNPNVFHNIRGKQDAK